MKEYRDHYFLKAKQENYPARSVYKLKEIDGRFKIFRKGMKVLDLGAAPGSWSLGAAERVGAQGKVLACDIQSTVTVFPQMWNSIRKTCSSAPRLLSGSSPKRGPSMSS